MVPAAMEAHEAFERFERSHHQAGHHESDDGGSASFATQAALLVAILAAFLAVATFKANEAVKDAIQEQTKVSDTHFQDQTELGRQIELELNYALLNAISINSPPSAAKQLQNAAGTLNDTANKLDPVIKALDSTAKDQAQAVKHQNDQHLLV
jgi:Domain of unknown function (DUF4337)